jgi:hypothetical protein
MNTPTMPPPFTWRLGWLRNAIVHPIGRHAGDGRVHAGVHARHPRPALIVPHASRRVLRRGSRVDAGIDAADPRPTS